MTWMHMMEAAVANLSKCKDYVDCGGVRCYLL